MSAPFTYDSRLVIRVEPYLGTLMREMEWVDRAGHWVDYGDQFGDRAPGVRLVHEAPQRAPNEPNCPHCATFRLLWRRLGETA